MPGNAFSYLRDNFTDNVQGEAWGGSFVTGSATKAETSGQARLTLPSSTAGTHSAYYRTGGTYNLTGDSFYWTIDTMVATGVAATATLDLYDTVDPTNILRWQQLSNAITARKVIAGVDTQLYTATWNSSTYKYLRIRESGGSILFDSSSNGTSWTNRATITGIPFDISLMAIQFGCSCGNVASPGSLRIEDVNLILPALTTTWHWTQVEWPLLYRFKSITLGATGGQGYIATSNDGTTWVYYSGPIGSSSGGYNSLTLQGSQAAAEAMAVTLPATDRWDLPSIVECRFIRLYHRSISGSSYGISEYYPRRLVQSDDIEAESIQAINIAANAITADKIFVLSLSALTASMGSLTMDGPIDITTGSIIGGGGVVTLDSGGLAIQQSASVLSIQSLQMIKADGTVIGRYGGSYATSHGLFIEGMAITGEQSFVDLTARAGTTDGAITYLRAVSGAVPALITLTSTGAAATIDLSASAGVTIAGAAAGLSIGTTGKPSIRHRGSRSRARARRPQPTPSSRSIHPARTRSM